MNYKEYVDKIKNIIYDKIKNIIYDKKLIRNKKLICNKKSIHVNYTYPDRELRKLFRVMDDGRYIYIRRCSICGEFIEVNALENEVFKDKIDKFMDTHKKKHINSDKEFVHMIEDYII